MSILKIEKINTFYGNIHALKSVTMSIEEGEIVTLIGANGAGKSTTLMSVCGVVHPKNGKIYFKDRDITDMEPEEIVALGISQVPEGRRIFPQLSVLENLDMGAFLRKDRDGIRKDLEEVFSIFPRLAERKNQQGGTLSGGEQQMLAISRALLARPTLMLLDEPSLGLAPIIVQQIFEIISRINKENGTTIFLVEQNANMALKIAHKGYVLQNGAIKIHDTAENLLADEEVRRAYLGV